MNVRIAEPPIGGTIDHILSVLPSLIPSAQRVARICAERPEDVVEMSGADLAAAAETSPPTVSRTCQALGFQGFQHLRMLLVRDLGAAARASRSREAGTWRGGCRGSPTARARSCARLWRRSIRRLSNRRPTRSSPLPGCYWSAPGRPAPRRRASR
ncbi:hypothetical protein K1X59_02570 [Microbacterium sp. Se5.02b]|nr:hypothetical protein K1X59_02570 [Microbacterium sp. Se5.02b]